MNNIEYIAIGRLQTLIGNAIHEYNDDVSPNRAERLLPLLEEAYKIVLMLYSKYPQKTISRETERRVIDHLIRNI